jgi:hypothetical protein
MSQALVRQALIEREIKSEAEDLLRAEVREIALVCTARGRSELFALFVLAGMSVDEIVDALDQIDRPN